MIKTITLITGNPGKLREIQQIAPAHIDLASRKIDLPEIQSLDLQAIVTDKIKRAYDIVKSPVIVEDVSAGLDELHGLPGPFYKFFRDEMGDEILVELAKLTSNKRITVTCTAAFYDGVKLIITQGVLKGTITTRRGENGFGFDPFIIPDGQSHTVAEMTDTEKNAISHRGLALRELFGRL